MQAFEIYKRGIMDLKRKDTPENRAFWESVEKAKEEWESIKPDWLKRLESRSSDKDGLTKERK